MRLRLDIGMSFRELLVSECGSCLNNYDVLPELRFLSILPLNCSFGVKRPRHRKGIIHGMVNFLCSRGITPVLLIGRVSKKVTFSGAGFQFTSKLLGYVDKCRAIKYFCGKR